MKIKKIFLWLRCQFYRYMIRYWTKEIRSLPHTDQTLFYEYLEHCNPSHYRPIMSSKLFTNGIESFKNQVLPRYIGVLKAHKGYQWVSDFDQDQRPLYRILRSAFINFEIIKKSREEAAWATKEIRRDSKISERKLNEESIKSLQTMIMEPARAEEIMKKGKLIPHRGWIFKKQFM